MGSKLKGIVTKLEQSMQCNCDLDNWEPERSTGHSWVCQIHRTAKLQLQYGPNHIASREVYSG